MYYFKNKISLKLLRKETEIDNDVIDGKIIPIDKTDICLLLDHIKVENNYVVKILKELDVQNGFNFLNPYPIDNKNRFQCLILKTDYDLYIKDYNFIPTKQSLTTQFTYTPSLVRDNEPTIKTHRYF